MGLSFGLWFSTCKFGFLFLNLTYFHWILVLGLECQFKLSFFLFSLHGMIVAEMNTRAWWDLFGNEKQVGGFDDILTRRALMGKQNTTLQNFMMLWHRALCYLFWDYAKWYKGREGEQRKWSIWGIFVSIFFF